jgi:thiol-disulfide isomerase/thioredoxin
MSTFLAIVGIAFLGVFVALPLLARAQARAFEGKDLPPLPGPTGERLATAGNALVYFFAPTCRMCGPLTPRFEQLRRKNRAVFLVNVAEELELARALKVMGTPSVVEIADGKVAGYYVGAVPEEVVARFG